MKKKKPRVRIRFVDETHYILHCDGGGRPLACSDPRVPEQAQRWISKHLSGTVDAAIVATSAGKLVGFFRFDYVKHKSRRGRRAIRALGTWVHHDFRRRGIATRMWTLAKRATRRTVIHVYTVSQSGAHFVSAIKKRVAA